MESRAGGLVRLPGSVGARPEGQSGAGLPVPVCHRVGLRRSKAQEAPTEWTACRTLGRSVGRD